MIDPLKNIKKFDRYELIHPLGHGGMGVVYLANDTELDRKVAIKCVENTDDGTQLTQRLRREAKLQARLNHSNVIQLYDVIENDDLLGLVIEYVEGNTLIAKYKEVLPSRPQQLQWLIQIAEGLHAAHQAGITHSDLKPDNILITHSGTIKIADFGIAKARRDVLASDEKLTMVGQVTGSYYSLSPEQASGAEVDFRTDLFAMGILIHLVLTGEHPFGDTSNHLLLAQRILNDEFVISDERRELLTEEIAELISGLLAKNPDQRPADLMAISHLFRKQLGQTASFATDYNNLTVQMPPLTPQKQRTPLVYLFAFGIAVIALSAAAIWWPQEQIELQYIAVTKPTVTVPEDFDNDQLQRIVTTIEHSLNEAVLANDYLALIPNTDLEEFDGDHRALAVANAADAVLLTHADCTLFQCEVRLQNLRGPDWMVGEQRVWPTVADSLSDIRITTFAEFPYLFPEIQINVTERGTEEISEQDYRYYLDIYNGSSGGSAANDATLHELTTLRSSAPTFLPIYTLYKSSAIHIYARSGDSEYLSKLSDFIDQAPTYLKDSNIFRSFQIQLLVNQSEFSEARKLLDELSNTTTDRILMNQLSSEFAYATGDYETALQLDRENAVLHPSVRNYYSLATSEFLYGNYDASKVMIDNALALYPNHVYSRNLSAAIALSEGNVPEAMQLYESLVSLDASSENFSNYGIALMLDGNYSDAIQAHLKAVELNPRNPAFLLNLADSYNLSGNSNKANIQYENVILETTSPAGAQEFAVRAQALAQLGQYNEALRTINSAELQFPNLSELYYSASIVHSLAGNYEAAVVELENAITSGYGAIWFRPYWFENLCRYTEVIDLLSTDKESQCQTNSR